ncbi:hypothetical protein KUCAC02_013973, partial [Chaenocephalus aceratus]
SRLTGDKLEEQASTAVCLSAPAPSRNMLAYPNKMKNQYMSPISPISCRTIDPDTMISQSLLGIMGYFVSNMRSMPEEEVAMFLTSHPHLLNSTEKQAWRRAWIRPLRRTPCEHPPASLLSRKSPGSAASPPATRTAGSSRISSAALLHIAPITDYSLLPPLLDLKFVLTRLPAGSSWGHSLTFPKDIIRQSRHFVQDHFAEPSKCLGSPSPLQVLEENQSLASFPPLVCGHLEELKYCYPPFTSTPWLFYVQVTVRELKRDMFIILKQRA